jgi:hypothetical protein
MAIPIKAEEHREDRIAQQYSYLGKINGAMSQKCEAAYVHGRKASSIEGYGEHERSG